MISPEMLMLSFNEKYQKQEEDIDVLITELETTKAELARLKNNIIHLKKKAAEIVALGEKQDECDMHEWYSMSPAPYLAELESFVEDIAELEEQKWMCLI